MSDGELQHEIEAILADAGIENFVWESRQIVRHLSSIMSSESQRLKAIAIAEKRCSNYPLQYLLGCWDFRDIEVEFPYHVLIPRPETEQLVDILIENLPKKRRLLGLEIGVGSGAISLALLSEMHELEMWANDISMDAIRTTMHNATKLGLSERIHIFLGDGLQALAGEWDFIISNPPYVDPEYVGHLQEELDHEPFDALFSRTGGMELTQRLIKRASELSCPLVLFELAEYNINLLGEFAWSCGFKPLIKADYNDRNIFLILR